MTQGSAIRYLSKPTCCWWPWEGRTSDNRWVSIHTTQKKKKKWHSRRKHRDWPIRLASSKPQQPWKYPVPHQGFDRAAAMKSNERELFPSIKLLRVRLQRKESDYHKTKLPFFCKRLSHICSLFLQKRMLQRWREERAREEAGERVLKTQCVDCRVSCLCPHWLKVWRQKVKNAPYLNRPWSHITFTHNPCS